MVAVAGRGLTEGRGCAILRRTLGKDKAVSGPKKFKAAVVTTVTTATGAVCAMTAKPPLGS